MRASTTVARLVPPEQRTPKTGSAVRLWSYPKVVFFYPTLLAALAAGTLTHYRPEDARTWGLAFMVVFGVNLLIVSFDFPRTSAISWFFFWLAVVLGAIMVNAWVIEFFPPLADLVARLDPEANDHFYWLVGGFLGLVYALIVVLDSRFDFWMVESLRIVHHHGLLDNKDQFPAPGMAIQKDITDVFEYLLLRSGRLVINLTNGESVVLENVLNVNRKMRDLEELLGVLPVEFAGGPPTHDHVAVSLYR